jgi:DNA ligase-associated metallophosphoesterase
MTHSATEIRGEQLLLLAEKAIYWQDRKTMIIADLHFGKISHFRKSGMAIPQEAITENWRKLVRLLTRFPIDRAIILGDLFHSDYNREWDQFVKVISQFRSIQFDLVIGNHDIINKELFREAGIHVSDKYLVDKPFLFVHDEADIPNNIENYVFCGHIHPGVKLKAPGMRSLVVPCYHFNKTRCVLPAFGNFTGYVCLKQKKGDQIHVISDEKVIKWA